jgi:hypothetical protein
MTSQDQAHAVARLLRELLLRPRYAAAWRHRQKHVHAGALHQEAIASVIADYLTETNKWSKSGHNLTSRSLKDPVSRALRGEVISAQTLEWFIGAFGMTPEDAQRLRNARNGNLASAGIPVVNTLRSAQELPILQRHRSIVVFEHRILGPDGAPVRHHASRAIIAQKDTVSCYPCRQFPDASEVIMLDGGSITAQHEPAGSSPILEMTLTSPLPVREVRSLKYQANFGPDASVETEYRQVAHARTSNLDIVVEFHHKRLPRRVWWAVWDDYRDGPPLAEQPVNLDPEGCVSRRLPYLENAAAGFRWEW